MLTKDHDNSLLLSGVVEVQTPLDVSIIIVNWNSADFVRRCVSSIRANLSGLAYEIIVADNASYDGCDSVLREFDSGVIYLQCDENLGFARANNFALKASRGASLLFLNPDTEIVGDAILRLHQALHRLPKAGAIGARLLNGDGTLQTSCIQSFPTIINQIFSFEFFRKMSPESDIWGMAPLFQKPAVACEVEGISGACIMIQRDVFDRIGRFSEDYFMYSEDIDLCYKTIKAGCKNYYVPEATIVHFGGSSSVQAASNFTSIMMRESIWRFLRKTRGGFYGLVYRCSMLIAAISRLTLLAVFFPVQALRRRKQPWEQSFNKWKAILRWTIGRESWAGNAGHHKNSND